jgi:hypothetical protein
MWMEIQVLRLGTDRHNNVLGLNRLLKSQPSLFGNWISNSTTDVNIQRKPDTAIVLSMFTLSFTDTAIVLSMLTLSFTDTAIVLSMFTLSFIFVILYDCF